MPTYRLRVELPDRPGALAEVTARIARGGANITALEIQSDEGPSAVDEIVVEVPEAWQPGVLAGDLAESGFATLLSSQLVTVIADPVVEALRSFASMVTATPAERDTECVALLLALTHGSSAWLSGVDAAKGIDAGRLALERGAPFVMRSQVDDDGAAAAGEPEPCWLLAVPDDPDHPRLVGFVTRPIRLRFTATELNRVEWVLRLCRRLEDLAGAATSS
jgi:hypothetical protein